MPATTDEPISGTDGRVIVEGTTIGLINHWTLEGSTGIIKIPHFEGPTDTVNGQTRMWTPKLLGLSDGQGTIEGYISVSPGTPTDANITNGISVTLALILVKATSFGYGVTAVLSNFRVEDAVENQPAKFSANFEVDGSIPVSNIIV